MNYKERPICTISLIDMQLIPYIGKIILWEGFGEHSYRSKFSWLFISITWGEIKTERTS